MHPEAAAALNEILVEAEILNPVEEPDGQLTLMPDRSFKWDDEIAWRCIRAAYARGYSDRHEHAPFPLTEASAYEREAWALLPVS